MVLEERERGGQLPIGHGSRRLIHGQPVSYSQTGITDAIAYVGVTNISFGKYNSEVTWIGVFRFGIIE
jgi:hypothetical protein